MEAMFFAKDKITHQREVHENIRADWDRIRSIEGYKNLTPRQRRLILLSLYAQERATRGTLRGSDEASEDALERTSNTIKIQREIELELENGNFYEHTPQSRQYRESQNLVSEMYCHISISDLERERLVFNPRRKKKYPSVHWTQTSRKEYYTATFEHILSLEEIRTFLLSQKFFPLVVFVGSSTEEISHSLVALGQEKENGELLVWEKMNFRLPFHITTLSEVFSRYKDFHYWGARPLENRQSLNLPKLPPLKHTRFED